MEKLRSYIKSQFLKKLDQVFLEQSEEKKKVELYKIGRMASDRGIGVLDVVELYYSSLMEMNPDLKSPERQKLLEITQEFLMECLAPYEMRQKGYQDLISTLQDRNADLQNEVERRRKSEENLASQKRYFQQLIENALDIITVLDAGGNIRYVSPAVESLLGYTPEGFVKKNVLEYIHPKDSDKVQDKLEKLALADGNTDSVQFRIRNKKGHYRHFESIAKNVSDVNGESAIIVNSREVTERVKAHRKLEKSENLLASAQNIALLGSWELDVENNEVIWSGEMCNIFEISPENSPDTFEEYMKFVYSSDREQVENTIQSALSDKCSFELEHRIMVSDGSLRTLLMRGEPIGADGGLVKMMGIAQDVTKFKENENKLRKYSEQLKNLSERLEKIRETERIRIAREIHDDLGQMLTVLKLDLSMVHKKLGANGSASQPETIAGEVKSALDRIDQITGSVQRIATELRPVILDNLGLKEAIEWQMSEFRNRTGIRVHFRNNTSSLEKLDEEQSTAIFRIFQETLTNIMRHAEANLVQVSLIEKGGHIILRVKDNGKGITDEDINHAKSIGIIGMRERSHSLGGDIKFSGSDGKGTTVTLNIPFSKRHLKSTNGKSNGKSDGKLIDA